MERSLIRGLPSIALLMLLGGVIAACRESPVAPPPPVNESISRAVVETQSDVTHTINIPGETLGLIAKWYSGDSNNWAKIKNANPGVVPERLRIGQQLQIPANIVTRRDPMTAEFVKKEFAALGKLTGGQVASPVVPANGPSGNLAGTEGMPASEKKVSAPVVLDHTQKNIDDRNTSVEVRARALEEIVGKPQENQEPSIGPKPGESVEIKAVETKPTEIPKPTPDSVQTPVVFGDGEEKVIEGSQKQAVGAGTNKVTEDEDAERQKLLRELLGGK